MPRDLAEVLHYFLPETEGGPATPTAPRALADRPRIVTVPLASDDLVRSALFWNLAVATARLSGGVRVVTLPSPDGPPLAPEPGRGPMGIEIFHADAGDPAALAACAEAAARGDGLVMTAMPPEWLVETRELGTLLAWVLALVRPDAREMVEGYAALKRVALRNSDARIGACIYGVQSLTQAGRAFDRLALTVDRHLERELVSYGMLIDDVQLSRSMVSRRPVALAYPSAPASRALTDVARLLLEAP